MDYFEPAFIRSAMQHGLLFNITAKVRFISVEVVDMKVFRVRTYFGDPPTEEEKELIEDSISQACGQFPVKINTNLLRDVIIRTDKRPFSELEHCSFLVYARNEDLNSEGKCKNNCIG